MADEVALQVVIPQRLKREISVRAAREGTTTRAIVLTALRDAGFAVAEEDLGDRRKERS